MDTVALIGYISLALGSALALFSRLPKQTIENQRELIDTYEKRLKALEDQKDEDRKQHIENVRAIADLQGQIKVYKELPLQQMATAMQEISNVNRTIAESNSKILNILTTSATTLAHNTEVVAQGTTAVAEALKTSNNHTSIIKEQTVNHQTVESHN